MPEAKRPDRVGEEFREVLAEEIPRLKDPRVGFVTVTGVNVSPDLRRAIVFYTALGEDADRRATRAGLVSAKGRLRRVLGAQVRLKFLPDLEFREDESMERGGRIEELLRDARRDDAAG